MRIPSSLPVALAAFFLCGSGCIVTRADLNREPFSGRVVPAAPTTIVTDVLFSDDVEGELDQVRMEPNARAGRTLTDSLALWLAAAGYGVEQQLSGVGVSSDSLALFEVMDDGDGSLSIHSGPLQMDASLASDAALFASVRTPEQAPRAGAGTEARRVVAVLRIRGRSVPVERSMAQAALTGLLTLGRKADFDRSALRAELFLLDAETGALVWAKRDGQQLQAPDMAAALALARQLVADVPAAGIESGQAESLILGAL